MYKYLKSMFKWNTVTTRIVWTLMVSFCVFFWYYSYQVFDFTIKLATQFMFGQ